MEYQPIARVAENWGISPRRLQVLCAQGKVEGAVRFGRAWMIPENAQKPADGRSRQSKQADIPAQDQPLPRNTPFLHMTDLYRRPGSAQASVEALEGHPEAQTLLAAEVAFSRGEIDTVYNSAHYLLYRRSGFYAVIAAGMLLARCAIWRGDLHLWRQAKIHIAEAPAKCAADRDIMAFSLTAIDSILYDVSSFPEWFKIGRFEPLHPDSLSAVKVFYAKYLYAVGYEVATRETSIQGIQGTGFLGVIPNILEPMISQAAADGALIAEIYLRLTCAAVYHSVQNDSQALFHIDRAIALALPDRLYGILAEYGRVLGFLLELQLSQADPVAWAEVSRLSNLYNTGWTKLSGSVRGKALTTTLTRKEREVAKLAAFGMKNAEIAQTLHMSVSAVKQAITNVSNKTGMSREEFAAVL